MRLLALCAGVDAQSDPDIPVLPYAGDDAAALWALAADWGEALARSGEFDESDCILLRGAGATRAAILDALERLAARSEKADYDLALLHFAGHGHGTGGLWGYDAAASAPEVGVSLADFTTAARRIRARHAVIAFDACFSGRASLLSSGGSGDTGPGSLPIDVSTHLRALADERRAVLWACGADERAWESPRLEHGLFTYGLVRALEHPETLERGRDLSLTAWIEQAYRIIAAEAAIDGRTQTPGRSVLWQGFSTLPRPEVGRRRQEQLAKRAILPITNEVQSLAVYGLRPEVLRALDLRLNGSPLSAMQQRAIVPGGLLAGKNILVCAPTSTGKTLIGELGALGAVSRGRRAMFLMPTRALVEEKYLEFCATFGSAGVVAVRSYGGVDDDDAALVALQFDVAFLTYEKCLGLFLQRPDTLDGLGVVVLDEVHLLGEARRGRSVEMLLGLLRARQSVGQRLQLVALSAALGDLGGFHEWLNANPVPPDPRPVPLRSGVVDPTGRFQYREESAAGVTFGEASLFDLNALEAPPPPTGPGAPRPFTSPEQIRREQVAATLVRDRLADPSAQILVFRATRPETRTLAQRLLGRVALTPSATAIDRLARAGATREETRASAQLKKCLDAGVGFHLADLDRHEREAVEAGVRAGEIRLTIATSTLAAGVNTPATDVILVDAERYESEAGGPVPYDIGEVRNTLGRAGRWVRGLRAGRGYLAAASAAEADALFKRYFVGEPETLHSQLGSTPRVDLVLALVGSRLAWSRDSVIDAVFQTFDGHQHEQDASWRQQQRKEVREAVNTLLQQGFVDEAAFDSSADAGRSSDSSLLAKETLILTPLGVVCAREGFRVASALRVLDGAERLRARGEPLDELSVIALSQITDELDDIYTSVSTKELGGWGPRLQRLIPDRPAVQDIVYTPDTKLHTCRLKRLFALLRWMEGAPVGDIERQFGVAFDEELTFAGMIRGFGERTAQVARSVAALLVVRHGREAADLRKSVVQLRPRLEYGLTRASADLARARIGLSRSEIHALVRGGCTTVEALAEALRMRVDEMGAVFGSSRLAELRVKLESGSLQRLRGRQRREDSVQEELFADLAPIREL